MDTPRVIPRSVSRAASADAAEARADARLRYVSAVALAVGVLSVVPLLLRGPNAGVRAGAARPAWVVLAGIAVAAAFYAAARSPRLSFAQRRGVALASLVAVSFLGSYFTHALPYAPADVVRGVSGVSLVTLFFAVVVATPPRTMALVALAAAVTDPLALALTVWAGNPRPPPRLVAWLLLPHLFTVPLAALSSVVVFQLRREAEAARELGSYRLKERLGGGGMGEVWRAEHRSLARPAAVKLIRPEVLEGGDARDVDTSLRRFELEAQAMASLSSPHTVELYDYGAAKDGSFYMVMELLVGMDLERLLKECAAPLPPARACGLLEQACLSLREAHALGIVHRDIKPANLHVGRVGGEWDFVKVLDFGIARRLSLPEADAKMTRDGLLVGSPAYMSPEAIRGEPVDGRSDLYALGCVAYEMLSGREVFAEAGVVAVLAAHMTRCSPAARCSPSRTGVVAVLAAHMTRAPLPLGEEVPAALAAAVMRCLAKSPDARPASAEALLAELRATGLATQWTQADAAAWWRERGAARASLAG
jgi:hypothetical protein